LFTKSLPEARFKVLVDKLAGIARDVFVLVGKFTFPADFVIVDYESDPRVPLILGRPFLRTARALSDVHGKEMILRDGDERLTLNMRHDTLSYSNQPQKESIKMINIYNDSYLVDEGNLTTPNDNLVDTILEMFTDEHTLDYSSPPLYDDFDDDHVEFESNNDDVYNDPFDSKDEKIKESKLLIDEFDLPRSSDFLPPSITTQVTPDKNVKKISISNAFLILEDFNHPLYELPFHKEVLGSKTLLSFSSKNEKKFSNPGFSLLKDFILHFS
nr:reverse transcriptase domain-containing protein [Tanacetum cinerariifolium]